MPTTAARCADCKAAPAAAANLCAGCLDAAYLTTCQASGVDPVLADGPTAAKAAAILNLPPHAGEDVA